MHFLKKRIRKYDYFFLVALYQSLSSLCALLCKKAYVENAHVCVIHHHYYAYIICFFSCLWIWWWWSSRRGGDVDNVDGDVKFTVSQAREHMLCVYIYIWKLYIFFSHFFRIVYHDTPRSRTTWESIFVPFHRYRRLLRRRHFVCMSVTCDASGSWTFLLRIEQSKKHKYLNMKVELLACSPFKYVCIWSVCVHNGE